MTTEPYSFSDIKYFLKNNTYILVEGFYFCFNLGKTILIFYMVFKFLFLKALIMAIIEIIYLKPLTIKHS